MRLALLLASVGMLFAQYYPPAGGGSGGSVAASSVTAGTFGAGNYTFPGNVTVGTSLFNVAALSTPTAPTVTQIGTPGATSYGYSVVAYNAVGVTLASSTTTTTTGNATLDNSNWNNVATVAVTGSTFCVVRRESGGSSQGNFANQIACGSTLQDKGLTADGYPVYWSVNTTDGSYIPNNLRVSGAVAFGVPTSYTGFGGNSTGNARPGVDPDDELEHAGNVFSVSGVTSDANYTLSSYVVDLTTAGSGVPVTQTYNMIINPASVLTQPILRSTISRIDNRSAVTTLGSTNAIAQYAVITNGGTGTFVNAIVNYGNCENYGGGSITNCFTFWTPAIGGVATNPYSFWSDEDGVFRIKSDNTFDSVYQAIPALYNPQFTKYTPGAVNYERIVEQWNGNVAEVGTEKGGSGTLRNLRLIGTQVLVNALKTTGAATGKTVVCVDVATGQLYASTSGVACAN